MKYATVRFQVSCSRLFRAKLRAETISLAFKLGMDDVDIKEEFGLIFGSLFVKAAGTEAQVSEFVHAWNKFASDWNK